MATMAKTFAADWSDRLTILGEWSMVAWMGRSRAVDGMLEAPTRQSIQRAGWLGLNLFAMGVQVDLMEQDGAGGIRFESYSRQTVWHVDAYGECSQVRPEGDTTRRTKLAGQVP